MTDRDALRDRLGDIEDEVVDETGTVVITNTVVGTEAADTELDPGETMTETTEVSI